MRGGPDLLPQAGEMATAGPLVHRVPVEMVLYQANGSGQMFLRRWRELGAQFRPVGLVWRVGERLVGQVDFAAPVGPERQNGLVVQLSTVLWESVA
ncbi:hypothetical protein [Brevundimonas diminuta]|uniref:hypothetical protein n=1 Tax=Brevundimonas diminuta TaxID=293 RepID=UPI000EBBA02F|nr:hypothetical protein [Brevundimonas diminuta]